jgi:hypothetical protein
VADHVHAIEKHVGTGLFDIVLVNNAFPPLAPDSNFRYVEAGTAGGNGSGPGFHIHRAPLVDERRPWRHDSEQLARVIMAMLEESGQRPSD